MKYKKISVFQSICLIVKLNKYAFRATFIYFNMWLSTYSGVTYSDLKLSNQFWYLKFRFDIIIVLCVCKRLHYKRIRLTQSIHCQHKSPPWLTLPPTRENCIQINSSTYKSASLPTSFTDLCSSVLLKLKLLAPPSALWRFHCLSRITNWKTLHVKSDLQTVVTWPEGLTDKQK